MKTTFLITLLLSISICSGQKSNMSYEEMLLDKASTIENVIGYTSLNSLIDDKDPTRLSYAKETKRQILSNAEEYYDKLIDSFPNSKLIYRAILGKAYIKYSTEEYQDAKKEFLKLYNTKDSLNLSYKYLEASTRFWIAINLAEIAIMDKEYENALIYLKNSTTFEVKHICLNAYYQNQAQYKYLLAKAYLGLKDYEKADSILIPNLFETGCLSDTGIVDLTIQTLQMKYSKAELKLLYEKAFADYHIEEGEYNKSPITRFYILFFNQKLYLPYYEQSKTTQEDREKSIRKVLANSKFYKKLNT